jgi:hypothetical protein
VYKISHISSMGLDDWHGYVNLNALQLTGTCIFYKVENLNSITVIQRSFEEIKVVA